MSAQNDIFFRRGSSALWSSVNPTLRSAELGYDTTENKFKIGDGTTPWNSLDWASNIGVSGEAIFPNSLNNISGIFFNTSFGAVDQVEGQLNWNNETGTIDVGLTPDLTMHVGQDIFFRVKNSTGNIITKGEAVAATGVLGGGEVVQVAPFAVDGSLDEIRFIGLVADDIANGDDGYVVSFGHIKNVDLRSTNTILNPNLETWNVGDILFVDDASAGGLTKVQPKDDIYVAMVLADGQNGELLVRISDPGHISILHDVNTSGVSDNNFLVWNNTAEEWQPSTGLYYVDDQLGIGTSSPISTLHVYSSTSGDNVFNVEGTNGSLFGVTDSLSGTLMSVNTIAGLPVLEVNSDYSVVAGRFNQNDFVITTSGDVGIGTENPTEKLHVAGDARITGAFYDSSNSAGSSTKVLLSTGTGTAWTEISTAALQGVQGIQGRQGIQGSQGSQGLQGIQGRQGTQGSQGGQGTQGVQGIQGITGPVAGSANQVVYKNASNVVSGNANFTFTETGSSLQVDNLKLDGNTLSATNTNGDVNVSPNGVGSIILGTSSTATGSYDAILGGTSNSTSATSCATLGGQNNSATKNYSATVAGIYGKTTRYGEIAHANGGFSNVAATAQEGTIVLWRSISANTTVELYSNGGTSIDTSAVNYFKLPDATIVNFDVQVAIVSSTNNDNGGWYNARGGIKVNGSPAAANLIGTLIEEYNYDTAGLAVTVDASSATDYRLRVQVTAPVSHNVWAVATIRYTQVSNGTP